MRQWYEVELRAYQGTLVDSCRRPWGGRNLIEEAGVTRVRVVASVDWEGGFPQSESIKIIADRECRGLSTRARNELEAIHERVSENLLGMN